MRRGIIEFLSLGGESTANIQTRLVNVCLHKPHSMTILETKDNQILIPGYTVTMF